MQQPPRLKDQQTKITKYFTLKDFIEFMVICMIAMGFSFLLLYNFAAHWKFLMFFITTASLIPLILKNGKNNAKNYVILWRLVVFWISPKNFVRGKEKDTSDLIPYSCMVNEYTIKNKKSKLRIYSKHTEDNYFMVLKIQGFNLWNEDKETQNSLIEEFANILDIIEKKYSFIKLPTTLNYDKNIKFIRNVKEKNDFYKKYNKSNINDFKNLKVNKLVDSYYLIINSSNIEELNEQYERLLEKFQSSFISGKRLEKEELLVFLKNLNLYQCTLKDIKSYLARNDIYNNPSSLEDLFYYEKVSFKYDSVKIDDKYVNINCLNKLPTTLSSKWIKEIFECEGIVIWKGIPFDDKSTDNLLNKVDIKLSANALEKLDATEEYKNDLAAENLNEQIRQITEDEFRLFDTNFYVVSICDDEKELKKRVKQNQNILSKRKIRLNTLTARQFFALSDVFNYPFTRLQKEFYEITSINLAYGFPFEYDDLNDNKNLLLGFSKNTKAPISFDIFDIKHSNRTNHNMFVLGSSGMGKSTFVMKTIASLISSNNKAIIIDPQAEYLDFAKKFKGQIIDLGSGINTCINPLQVRNQLRNKDNEDTMIHVVNKHIGFLENFFKSLIDFPNRNSWNLFIKIVRDFYTNEGVYKMKSLAEKKDEEWKTISDFIIFMKEYKSKLIAKDEANKNDDEKTRIEYLKNIIEDFEINFEENGKYQQLYNGITTIKIQNDLVVFNTANLSINDANASKIAIMIILNFVNEIIFNNWLNNETIKNNYKQKNNINLLSSEQLDKLISRVLLCIDEEHIYIDPNKPEIMNFIVETTKTIRKYDGGTIHTTQNPSDYKSDPRISENAKRIIQNCQYSVFFGLKDDDIDAVKDLFKNSQKLLSSEIKYLGSREKGRILASFTNNQRMRMELYYNDLEKEMFFKKGF